LAVLDVVAQPGFLANVRTAGDALALGLARLVEQYGLVETRGRGLLQAVVLRRSDAIAIRDACMGRGLLLNAARDNVLRFMPSLRVTSSEIASMLEILADVLGSLR
jgi:acetylornithine/succinyldiaminopimelate/putrescine aminotransferase